MHNQMLLNCVFDKSVGVNFAQIIGYGNQTMGRQIFVAF
jgi:hypothetical protein